jgi:signal transduction histidine kinase
MLRKSFDETCWVPILIHILLIIILFHTDVKSKLLDLVTLYEKINDGANTRNIELEDTIEVADKFWDDLNSLQRTLKDLSDTLANQEPPALEPSIIREQQDTLEVINV